MDLGILPNKHFVKMCSFDGLSLDFMVLVIDNELREMVIKPTLVKQDKNGATFIEFSAKGIDPKNVESTTCKEEDDKSPSKCQHIFNRLWDECAKSGYLKTVTKIKLDRSMNILYINTSELVNYIKW